MEMSAIGRLLKRARRWHHVAADIKPLKQGPSTIGRALAPEQKNKLLEVVRSKPEWLAVRCAIELALYTTMRGGELKHLRWRNVDFKNRVINVGRSKTAAGLRTIPLSKTAFQALSDLWDRARELGSTEPDHYVFPKCENGQFDATKPQKSWRTSFRKITSLAGLKGLRFHDLRHHAITELAETGATDYTILSIAGHVSRRMLDHYCHVRLEPKKKALDLLERKPKRKKRAKEVQPTEDVHVTNHVTKVPAEGLPPLQVIESIMGATGIEPMTSTVSR
jgi:integrase